MPDIEKLHLEDALEDSPQTRQLLSVFEKDAMMLKKYSVGLHNCCQRTMKAQKELCAATQAMAQHLRAYEIQKFPLESEDSILISTLKQFSSYLDDVSSIQQVLSAQFSETMMYPMTKFLQADLEEISTMYEVFQIASHDHDSAHSKYMKLPKKKDNEKLRQEVSQELYVMRKKFHQTALHYYSSLNALQYKRKCFLLEPVLGYLHAQRAFFQMGQNAVCKPDIEDFLGNINASIQDVHTELQIETQKTVGLIDTLEDQSAHLYHVEPPVDMPYIPPNTQLSQKGGYLLIRNKQLLQTKWERCFFFTQAGNLMVQAKKERKSNIFLAGSLVLDLNEEGVFAEPTEADDRRFLFQVLSARTKRSFVLQAENERDRDEWISTINNIIREGGYVKGKPLQPKKKEPEPSIVKSESRSASASASSSPEHSSSNSSLGMKSPPSIVSTPSDSLLVDTPIQFDMIVPSEENKSLNCPLPGPPKRINPFDQSPDASVNNAAFAQSFTVRFFGSMEVKADRGEQLVRDTMRQIMAARAMHNIFKMTESKLLITSETMRLLDPSNSSLRTEFSLEDISYWCTHHENTRLFGFITRTKTASGSSFACHVFESNSSAEEICQAISAATKLAFQSLMQRKANEKVQKIKEKEKDILLSNIHSLEDADEESILSANPPLSPDGRYLILTSPDDFEDGLDSLNLNSPVTEQRMSDDAKVEAEEEEGESEA